MTTLALIESKAPELTSLVEVLPLATPADIATATDVLRQVKTLEKALEEERKALVAPLKAESSAIDARYREPRRALERIEGLLKSRIAEVHAEAERARTAALVAASTAAQAGDHAAATAAIVEAAAPPPETPGVSVRYKWAAVTTDITRIPREYMTVDVEALRRVAQDAGGGPTPPPTIPGVLWIREPIVTAQSANPRTRWEK
ncbi:hypothetical protein K0U83_11990 [bacterium]|nr:hypothetical protein [bacterium]